MSQDEHLLAIGRIVTEYKEVTHKLVTLGSELARIGMRLREISNYMLPHDYKEAGFLSRHQSPPGLDDYPTREQLTELFVEANGMARRKKQLSEQLRNLGIEPKD